MRSNHENIKASKIKCFYENRYYKIGRVDCYKYLNFTTQTVGKFKIIIKGGRVKNTFFTQEVCAHTPKLLYAQKTCLNGENYGKNWNVYELRMQ